MPLQSNVQYDPNNPADCPCFVHNSHFCWWFYTAANIGLVSDARLLRLQLVSVLVTVLGKCTWHTVGSDVINHNEHLVYPVFMSEPHGCCRRPKHFVLHPDFHINSRSRSQVFTMISSNPSKWLIILTLFQDEPVSMAWICKEIQITRGLLISASELLSYWLIERNTNVQCLTRWCLTEGF